MLFRYKERRCPNSNIFSLLLSSSVFRLLASVLEVPAEATDGSAGAGGRGCTFTVQGIAYAHEEGVLDGEVVNAEAEAPAEAYFLVTR